MSAGQGEVIAQEVHQEQPTLDVAGHYSRPELLTLSVTRGGRSVDARQHEER